MEPKVYDPINRKNILKGILVGVGIFAISYTANWAYDYLNKDKEQTLVQTTLTSSDEKNNEKVVQEQQPTQIYITNTGNGDVIVGDENINRSKVTAPLYQLPQNLELTIQSGTQGNNTRNSSTQGSQSLDGKLGSGTTGGNTSTNSTTNYSKLDPFSTVGFELNNCDDYKN